MQGEAPDPAPEGAAAGLSRSDDRDSERPPADGEAAADLDSLLNRLLPRREGEVPTEEEGPFRPLSRAGERPSLPTTKKPSPSATGFAFEAEEGAEAEAAFELRLLPPREAEELCSCFWPPRESRALFMRARFCMVLEPVPSGGPLLLGNRERRVAGGGFEEAATPALAAGGALAAAAAPAAMARLEGPATRRSLGAEAAWGAEAVEANVTRPVTFPEPLAPWLGRAGTGGAGAGGRALRVGGGTLTGGLRTRKVTPFRERSSTLSLPPYYNYNG
jgi:hypothetical protein